MGNVVEPVDISAFRENEQRHLERKKREEHEMETLRDTSAFTTVWFARKYDDWFIDPAVGFFFPEIGDVISSVATFPALYFAAVKLKSFRLTIAILTTILIDLAIGAIPIAGDIADAFHKSSKISSRLIVGYMDNDPKTLSEINKRATVGLLIAALLIWLVYLLVGWISKNFNS